MGVDSEGESILISKPNEKMICQQLMTSHLKPIESCLGHGRLSASLKRAILEIVASGVASTPEDVKKYADCTFLAHSAKKNIEVIRNDLKFKKSSILKLNAIFVSGSDKVVYRIFRRERIHEAAREW